MKLTVIGAGGVRSMFLAKSIAQRAGELDISELSFMDNDADKLRIFGRMAAQVARRLAPQMAFVATDHAEEALRDADHVITTLRVGGDSLRVRDEHIALDAGVLGQETTGAAGFSFAMRSIPALLQYCEMVRRLAKPGACVFNFTNPVGIVSQALRDAGYDFTYGICDAPSGMLHQFAALYNAAPNDLQGELFGLNHLSWFHAIRYQARDIMPELLANPAARQQTDLRFFEPDLLAFIGCIPNEYLYYYYYREQALANILRSGKTRGDAIMEINRAMQQELAGVDVSRDFDRALAIFSKWHGRREDQYMANETGIRRDKPWQFDVHSPDAGGYAGVALRFIEILRSGKPGQMILSVPNQGAVDFLAPGDTVEATCDISAKGAQPHRFAQIPPQQQELIRRVKYYERAGAQAILRRSKTLAIEALMLHPLVNSYSLARRLAEQYIALNQAYTGPWEA